MVSGLPHEHVVLQRDESHSSEWKLDICRRQRSPSNSLFISMQRMMLGEKILVCESLSEHFFLVEGDMFPLFFSTKQGPADNLKRH